MGEETAVFDQTSEPETTGRSPALAPEADGFEEFPLAASAAVAGRPSAPPPSAAPAPLLAAPPAHAQRDTDPLAETVHLTAASFGAAMAGGAQRAYRWRDTQGEETPLERRDVIRLIRDGSLRPEDNLAADGSAFQQAGEFEDLKRYFQMRLAPVSVPAAGRGAGPLLGCTKHPQTHAAWCCGMCGSYWCQACAPQKRISSTAVTPCPHCSELCMPVQAHVEVVPFWREIGELFLYPVKGWGAAMWIMYSLIVWFSQVVIALGVLNLFLWACLNFFALTYSMRIVKDSAEGGRKVPDWPDFSEWWEIIGRGFRGFLCTVIALLPLAAYGFLIWKTFGAGAAKPADVLKAAGIFVLGAIPLGVFTAIYYPMVFLIASLFDTILPALNPILVFKAMARIPLDYTIALIFIYVLVITGAVLSVPFHFIPLIGGLPAAIVNSYFTFIWLHVLGRMAHQCEERLNWSV